MIKVSASIRSGLLTFILALVGFSFALATSDIDRDNIVSVNRALGSFVPPGGFSPLDFANPLVTEAGASSERDLGDYVEDPETTVSRLVRAKFGIAPYRFSSDAGVNIVGLHLLANGLLRGTPTAPTGASTIGSTPFRFNVTVTDAFGKAGNSRTAVYRLSYVVTSQFRFAVDKLSDGVQFNSYSEIVSTINGVSPITCAASDVKLDGVVQSGGLADVGLGLSSDGALYGSPFKPGRLTFTCTATDSNGTKAASRAGSGNSQIISIKLIGSKSLSSLITASEITIKQGVTDGASISYKGVVNFLGNRPISSLSGFPFSFHIGSYAGPSGTFSKRGRVKSTSKDRPVLRVVVSTLGLIEIEVSKANIDVGVVTGSTVNLPVEVRIGDSVIGSEVLTFSVKTKGAAKTLTYNAGKNADLDGSFQLTSVEGSDDKALRGDSWKVGFIGRAGPVRFDTFSSINFSIGSGFTEKQMAVVKGTKVLATGAATDGINSFSVDLIRGKGSLITNLLPSSKTGISPAKKAGSRDSTYFTTNITFGTTGFSFDGAIGINPKGTTWSSKLLR